MIKLLPKGIQSFEKMITNNYVYVDKTKYIYDIIKTGDYYFFSRPRRFGKSVLISTLKELFEGNKALFKGLWIETSDYKWQNHPVIHLSFSSLSNNNAQALYDDLVWKLESIASLHSIDITTAPSLKTKFELLVTELSKVNKVVILVDEYDHPILSNISDLKLADECREVLKSFFDVVKDLDNYLAFFMVTGVSKFAKTSLFSGLNNLEDLTLSELGSELVGYTYEELIKYFDFYIEKAALKNRSTADEIIDDMRTWYDGYQFSKNAQEHIYNPYSILLFLSNLEFLNYWFATGTPTFLLQVIKAKQFSILSLDDASITPDDLDSVNIEDITVIPLLFQTGYLTIKFYDEQKSNYLLDFPNLEVKQSFFKFILKGFSTLEYAVINDFATKFTNALKENNIDLFCRLLQNFFADIPSGIQIPEREKYYQTIIYVITKIIGIDVKAEVMTNIGRIDMIIETLSHHYIFEFKIQGSAEEALKQIEEKQYYQKYLMTGKKIVLIGVFFDIKKRNLENWAIKEINLL